MAQPTKAQEAMRRQKDARQRKLLLILAPVLVVVLAIQGPRLVKQLRGAKDATKAVSAQVESAQDKVVQGYGELAPTTPTTTAAEPASGDVVPGPALLASGGLPNTNRTPQADEGQLVSFTRFTARDPFVQLVDADGEAAPDESSAESGSGSGGTSSTSTSGTSSPGTSTGGTTTGGTTGVAPSDGTGTAETQSVTLSVNGNVILVSVGDTFPPSDPAFQLVAVEGDVAKIGLAEGSFSNGVETIDLEVGETVTLISQPDGARFTIKLVAVGAA